MSPLAAETREGIKRLAIPPSTALAVRDVLKGTPSNSIESLRSSHSFASSQSGADEEEERAAATSTRKGEEATPPTPITAREQNRTDSDQDSSRATTAAVTQPASSLSVTTAALPSEDEEEEGQDGQEEEKARDATEQEATTVLTSSDGADRTRAATMPVTANVAGATASSVRPSPQQQQTQHQTAARTFLPPSAVKLDEEAAVVASSHKLRLALPQPIRARANLLPDGPLPDRGRSASARTLGVVHAEVSLLPARYWYWLAW